MQYIRDNRLTGDYLEFGVYKGESFCASYYFSKLIVRNDMLFYAFDSFEGLPKVKEESRFYEGQYCISKEGFKDILKKRKVNLWYVGIVGGWFKDLHIKRNVGINKASFIYIDCDLYESTVSVLEYVTPYIQNGTLIAFDDWNMFKGNKNKGEKRAFLEWLRKHKNITAVEFLRFGYHGNSFILNT